MFLFYYSNWTVHGTVLDGRSFGVECHCIVSYINIGLHTLFPGDLWFLEIGRCAAAAMNALMTFYWTICVYECIVNDNRNEERSLLTFSMTKYVSYNIIRSDYGGDPKPKQLKIDHRRKRLFYVDVIIYVLHLVLVKLISLSKSAS